MKTVLWMSRHDPLPIQKDTLKKKLGDYKLFVHKQPLSTAEEAIKLAKKYNADYIIPVLPLSFIAYLIDEAKKHNITILRAEMKLIHNCTNIPCPDFDPYTDVIISSKDFNHNLTHRHFRFEKFSILKAIKIETEDF